METYQNYKGYGITYTTFGGTTTVDYAGRTVKIFPRLGESDGLEAAKEYVDNVTSRCCHF